MNIYLLKRDDEQIGYDEADSFVVAALGVRAARELAAKDAGDEGDEAWLEAGRSTCRKLGEGSVKAGVVVRSFNAG